MLYLKGKEGEVADEIVQISSGLYLKAWKSC